MLRYTTDSDVRVFYIEILHGWYFFSVGHLSLCRLTGSLGVWVNLVTFVILFLDCKAPLQSVEVLVCYTIPIIESFENRLTAYQKMKQRDKLRVCMHVTEVGRSCRKDENIIFPLDLQYSAAVPALKIFSCHTDIKPPYLVCPRGGSDFHKQMCCSL